MQDIGVTIKTIKPPLPRGTRVTMTTGVPGNVDERGYNLVRPGPKTEHTVWKEVEITLPTKCEVCNLSMIKTTKTWELNDAEILVPEYDVHCLHCGHHQIIRGEVIEDA